MTQEILNRLSEYSPKVLKAHMVKVENYLKYKPIRNWAQFLFNPDKGIPATKIEIEGY